MIVCVGEGMRSLFMHSRTIEICLLDDIGKRDWQVVWIVVVISMRCCGGNNEVGISALGFGKVLLNNHRFL